MESYTLLDTVNMSEYFFENTQIFGVGSGLSPIAFCHSFNSHLSLDFKREYSYDWHLKYDNKKKKKKNATHFHPLFDSESESADILDVFFPVFYDKIDSSDTEFYIYTNKIQGSVYIKQEKHIDFFLLIKNGQYLDYNSDIQSYILKIKGILFCTKYNLSEINWKDNLIL